MKKYFLLYNPDNEKTTAKAQSLSAEFLASGNAVFSVSDADIKAGLDAADYLVCVISEPDEMSARTFDESWRYFENELAWKRKLTGEIVIVADGDASRFRLPFRLRNRRVISFDTAVSASIDGEVAVPAATPMPPPVPPEPAKATTYVDPALNAVPDGRGIDNENDPEESNEAAAEIESEPYDFEEFDDRTVDNSIDKEQAETDFYDEAYYKKIFQDAYDAHKTAEDNTTAPKPNPPKASYPPIKDNPPDNSAIYNSPRDPFPHEYGLGPPKKPRAKTKGGGLIFFIFLITLVIIIINIIFSLTDEEMSCSDESTGIFFSQNVIVREYSGIDGTYPDTAAVILNEPALQESSYECR